MWKKWGPIISAYPIPSQIGDQEPDYELVKIAYQYVPDEIIESLIIMIDKDNREGGYLFSGRRIEFRTRKMEAYWDERLANALLIKAKDERLEPQCMSSLLSNLLDHKIKEARAFAESLIPLPPPASGVERSKAILTAYVLMTHADDAGWTAVWPAIQVDAEFCREVLSAITYDGHVASVVQKLTDDQLADLCIWLVRQYPHAENPKYEGTDYIWIREDVPMWRNTILSHLKHRGTPQAYATLQRIARELPQLDRPKWALPEAQNIILHRTWIPPHPSDIVKLASNQQAHLVQNGDQLLEVLIESLKRLETKLQEKDTPAAIDLWNEPGNVYTPKDENRLSDKVKRHLKEDLEKRGVVLNREVQIRRGEGSVRGERTDIHVDAVVQEPRDKVYDSITAIIEVKGPWNNDLNRAMKTQLVDRYLKHNQCQHGLYLVGWFNCDQWSAEDYRKKKNQIPKISIHEARKKFDAQAAKLSQHGIRIKAFVINAALPREQET